VHGSVGVCGAVQHASSCCIAQVCMCIGVYRCVSIHVYVCVCVSVCVLVCVHVLFLEPGADHHSIIAESEFVTQAVHAYEKFIMFQDTTWRTSTMVCVPKAVTLLLPLYVS
jgi:hypothetical protein